MSALATHTEAPLPDDDRGLARRAAEDHAAFERLMRRYNGRLFRVARAMLKSDADAEDALQDAYLDAYRHLDRFRGDASLATWLTRIVINHALGRLRKQGRQPVIVPFADRHAEDAEMHTIDSVADEAAEPVSTTVIRRELRRLLEQRIDELPVAFRVVFVMREVEGLSVDDTAEALDIPPATVRTRFFRARALLRETLAKDVDPEALNVFGFAGDRCDRIVARVMARL